MPSGRSSRKRRGSSRTRRWAGRRRLPRLRSRTIDKEVAMIRRSLAAFAVVAIAAGSAAADEGHSQATQKMMGTVKAVHADMNHVELATKDGVKGFYVNASTRFFRGGAKIAFADLKPGSRVVVQAKT